WFSAGADGVGDAGSPCGAGRTRDGGATGGRPIGGRVSAAAVPGNTTSPSWAVVAATPRARRARRCAPDGATARPTVVAIIPSRPGTAAKATITTISAHHARTMQTPLAATAASRRSNDGAGVRRI